MYKTPPSVIAHYFTLVFFLLHFLIYRKLKCRLMWQWLGGTSVVLFGFLRETRVAASAHNALV